MNLEKLMVTKRSGDKVPYDQRRIYRAISGANKDANSSLSKDEMDLIIKQVEVCIKNKIKYKTNIHVEEIQDIVEKSLMKFNYYDVAKEYITYRQKHNERRQAQEELMESYRDIFFTKSENVDFKRDNANINADAPMGMLFKLGAEGAKKFADEYVIPEKFVKADHEAYIHIHDKDLSLICPNCCQIDLGKLLKKGFNTGHGYLRPPTSIRSAASLGCISIQANQNDMLGGQSINAWDWALAPYVDKSFKRYFKKAVENFKKIAKIERKDTLSPERIDDRYNICYAEEGTDKYKEELKKVKDLFLGASFETDNEYITADIPKTIYDIAIENTVEETHQAMEAAVHNFNTLNSRSGGQVPFSSLNMGINTTPEGRLVIRETLNALYQGIGNGETSIFPIVIFQLKTGVNYNPEDINYDLFQLACKVSAKRMYPNFLSLDSSFNSPYYKEGDYNTFVSAMGCRTRVVGNVNGPEISGSRGNFSFVTINLPKLALEVLNSNLNNTSDKEEIKTKFFRLFDKYINLSKEYLEHRYEIIAKKHVYNFPFLMGQGIWLDSDKLKQSDEIGSVLKHCSLSIGFCGLAECLTALTGHHHGESEEARNLGLEIISHLREMTDKFTAKTKMNWSTFATPAEGCNGTFQRANRKKYGIIPGVTDSDYMTNSFHVRPNYKINAIDKIKIEAPYHDYCNAGAISYIEMDGDPSKNLKAFESIIRAMHDNNMGYYAVNHPADRDPICGYNGIIDSECPHCHRKENSIRFTIPKIED